MTLDKLLVGDGVKIRFKKDACSTFGVLQDQASNSMPSWLHRTVDSFRQALDRLPSVLSCLSREARKESTHHNRRNNPPRRINSRLFPDTRSYFRFEPGIPEGASIALYSSGPAFGALMTNCATSPMLARFPSC